MRCAVLTFLCLTSVAHADILLDIWHNIEKSLEGFREEALGSVFRNSISSVLAQFGRRDLPHLAINLHDEVLRWMQEAHQRVEHEITEMEHAEKHPDGEFSDRAHELLEAFQQAKKHGNVQKFIDDYSQDIVKQFVATLPGRLKSRLWIQTNKVLRKTRGNDILIQMLKNITVAHWFFSMPEMERLFLVAMLDAAEHGHLHDFVKHHSFDRVLVFIDHLPDAEGHKLNHYLVKHLDLENKSNHTTKPQVAPKRDVEEFLRMLNEIYSEHIYSLLDKEDRLFFLEMMDAAEHNTLTSFIADNSMERVQKLTEGVPKEASDRLMDFVTKRLKNETKSDRHHHHDLRNPDILLTILKDIHTADIFFHLPEPERKFLLELMDAAENNHLDAFVGKVGLQRVRNFVIHLPEDYQKAMTHYIQNHLHHHMTTTPPPTHHSAIMLTILKDIHTAAIFMELPTSEQSLVLQLLDAGENGHITTEVSKIGGHRLKTLANHLPSPYKEQLTTYVVQHLNAEKTTTAPQVAVRKTSDSGVVEYGMTNEQRLFYNQLKHAAENEDLKAFIRKVGVARVIKFLEGLTDPFSQLLQQLITRELAEEDKVIKPLTPKLKKRAHGHGHETIHQSVHHIGQHLTENHGHYSQDHHKFYEDLKHAIEHHQLKAFLEHVGTDTLYAFLDAIPQNYTESLESHILVELEMEDHVHT
ncbi:uncharacterized protein LOC135471559 [Liolophura sinensis]|uniref:uncharacterized protein LOC135471559 n=1 Tax=Liolophura sinensis TaxID=3198878 RepID=UPI003158F2FE